MNEDEISILSLTDEEGNEVEFELIDSVDFEGAEYLILLPPEEEASEVKSDMGIRIDLTWQSGSAVSGTYADNSTYLKDAGRIVSPCEI